MRVLVDTNVHYRKPVGTTKGRCATIGIGKLVRKSAGAIRHDYAVFPGIWWYIFMKTEVIDEGC